MDISISSERIITNEDTLIDTRLIGKNFKELSIEEIGYKPFRLHTDKETLLVHIESLCEKKS